eukprot:1137222-Pelagomonas_calceolata.AAC.8
MGVYEAWYPARCLTATTQWPVQTTSRCRDTLHTILLGVGGTIYNAHTLDQFKQLGIDPQRCTKLARKLHAHFVRYAIENKNTHYISGALGPGAARNPPELH